MAKKLADKLTADELDHLVTLEMMGNDEITSKYLSSLQDKYGSGSASSPNIGKDLTEGEKAELAVQVQALLVHHHRRKMILSSKIIKLNKS